MSDYDNKDYTGWDLSDRKDMDGLTITGLCLSNEIPFSKVLPPDLKGATFIHCNLDNVVIPEGNTLVECSNRFFKCQNDGEDWLIKKDTKEPLTPVNKHKFDKLKLSTSPADIPDEKLDMSVVSTKIIDDANLREQKIKDFSDAETLKEEADNGIN